MTENGYEIDNERIENKNIKECLDKINSINKIIKKLTERIKQLERNISYQAIQKTLDKHYEQTRRC